MPEEYPSQWPIKLIAVAVAVIAWWCFALDQRGRYQTSTTGLDNGLVLTITDTRTGEVWVKSPTRTGMDVKYLGKPADSTYISPPTFSR